MAKEKEKAKLRVQLMVNAKCPGCGQALEQSGDRAVCRSVGCENEGRYYALPSVELEEHDDQSGRA